MRVTLLIRVSFYSTTTNYKRLRAAESFEILSITINRDFIIPFTLWQSVQPFQTNLVLLEPVLYLNLLMILQSAHDQQLRRLALKYGYLNSPLTLPMPSPTVALNGCFPTIQQSSPLYKETNTADTSNIQPSSDVQHSEEPLTHLDRL